MFGKHCLKGFIVSIVCLSLLLSGDVFSNRPCRGAEETPYLPRGLDALDDSHADQDPGHQQGQGHLPVQPSSVVNGAGDIESLAVPEVSGG